MAVKNPLHLLLAVEMHEGRDKQDKGPDENCILQLAEMGLRIVASSILLLTHMLELPTDPALSSINCAQSIDEGRLETWQEQRLLTRIQYDVPMEVSPVMAIIAAAEPQCLLA